MEQGEIKTMRLPVKLTAGELALRGQELATSESAMGDAENRLESFLEAAKGTKKQIEADISDARGEVRRLARVVREKREDREVQVEDVIDFEGGSVDTHRLDTNEIVATRGMTHEERQRSLFEDKNKAKSKK